MIANPGYGIAEYTLAATCPTCPAQPPAKRVYDGVEFRLRKRLSNRWSMNTSYTYSHLRRQLLRPDELGRERPQQPERPALLRRPLHVVRRARQPDRRASCRPTARTTSSCRGPTTCPGAPASASNYQAASGTLQQSTITYKSVPVFDEARGNLGRSPIYTQTDYLLPSTTCRCRGCAMNLGVNVINLFDQDTVTRLFTTRYRDRHRRHHRRAVLRPGFDVAGARRRRVACGRTRASTRPISSWARARSACRRGSASRSEREPQLQVG